jgi:hypothetical protein
MRVRGFCKNHPSRRHYAKGLCKSCYSTAWWKALPVNVKQQKRKNETARMPLYRQRTNLKMKIIYAELKKKVFDLYGNKCNLCGYGDVRVLQIDHILSNGKEHRKTLINHGDAFFKDVLAHPKYFQLLCANCNWLKRTTEKEHMAVDFFKIQELKDELARLEGTQC